MTDAAGITEAVRQIGKQARAASRLLTRASTAQKNAALEFGAADIERSLPALLEANERDMAAATDLTSASRDRLRLDESRIRKIARAVREVAALPDPVGEVIGEWSRADGLQFQRVRVPIGVIGIIYEARPNVTSDAASLCLKSGNAVILRGGSESIHSNLLLAECLRTGCEKAGLPADAVQIIPHVDRTAVRAMAELVESIDLIIPRGGKPLIELVTSLARMPVIKHYDGICHVYVDAAADLGMAQEIVLNAKCQRPGVCNAMECLLVHEAVAASFLQKVGSALWANGVEIRGDARVREILGKQVVPATEEDWRTEYLDLKLSAKVVPNLEAAVEHIESYGSHHSDAIVTDDQTAADKFLRQVDSAAVFWNASTRFNDGAEFGFGAEIGISTERLHARGPMALPELTTYKYLVRGTGHVRT
jgi:glutamate-5-semialdehyde dehydrogenase